MLNPAFVHSWYGDDALLNETWLTGKAYAGYLNSKLTAGGLLTEGLGDWLDVCGNGQGDCS